MSDLAETVSLPSVPFLPPGNLKYRALAYLYLAREELIASTQQAETAVNRALVEAAKMEEDKEVAFVAGQIRRLEAETKAKKAAGLDMHNNAIKAEVRSAVR